MKDKTVEFINIFIIIFLIASIIISGAIHYARKMKNEIYQERLERAKIIVKGNEKLEKLLEIYNRDHKITDHEMKELIRVANIRGSEF